MCLYPIKIPNPMFVRHGGELSPHYDTRLMEKEFSEFELKGFKRKDLSRYDTHIIVPCRRCHECLRSDAQQWRFRLEQESKKYSPSSRHIFVTLTFNDHYYDYNNPTDISRYLREFSDTLYLRFGRRLRHWYVTELGEKRHRLHLHGIIYDFPRITENGYELKGKLLNSWFEDNLWKFGFVWIGYVDNRTFNYVTKYITKPQKTDWYHKPRVFCSPRLGSDDSLVLDKLKSLSLTTGDFLYAKNGKSRFLPKYYRNQLRKYLSPAVYYRCLDRSMSQMGTKYVVLGRRYDNYSQYISALQRARQMYENAFSERVKTLFISQRSILNYGYTSPV